MNERSNWSECETSEMLIGLQALESGMPMNFLVLSTLCTDEETETQGTQPRFLAIPPVSQLKKKKIKFYFANWQGELYNGNNTHFNVSVLVVSYFIHLYKPFWEHCHKEHSPKLECDSNSPVSFPPCFLWNDCLHALAHIF